MPRYIDADKLFTWLDIKNRSKYPIADAEQYNTLLIYEVFGEIDDAETEDVALVIHAHWIEWAEGRAYHYTCSSCRFGTHRNTNFCPDCGAKMDEEALRCSSSK